jgi:hypothetical protein
MNLVCPISGPPVCRPIIFSGESVHGIQALRKTQTRRPVAWPETEEPEDDTWVRDGWPYFRRRNRIGAYDEIPITCRYGKAGDILWVRETYSTTRLDTYPFPSCWYRADFSSYDDPAKGNHVQVEQHDGKCGAGPSDCIACGDEKFKWKSPIFMPRHHARTWLEVTEVRAEPLQTITKADAALEGIIETFLPMATCSGTFVYSIEPYPCASVSATAIDAYRVGWDHINAKRAPWAENPWVWVITFRPLSSSQVHDYLASTALRRERAAARPRRFQT